MNKIYLIALLIALITISYFYGSNVADAKCKLFFSQQESKKLQQNQKQFLQNKRLIDDKIYKTGVNDIRGILFDKYTITE